MRVAWFNHHQFYSPKWVGDALVLSEVALGCTRGSTFDSHALFSYKALFLLIFLALLSPNRAA